MIERVFVGWDQPFLLKASSWLLERKNSLPHFCVVVPTAQSGRRLREALAEAAGAILSPTVVTPGAFLKFRDHEAAPDWAEHVAWVEVLENIADWTPYTALFPEPPGEGKNWAGALARELVGLRRSLQENGLLLSSAARKLRESVEAERWQALGILEELVERKLTSWNLKSRSRLLTEGIDLPGNFSHIILAGVPEMPPLVERALLAWGKSVTTLIGAPADEAANFSPAGRALASWCERPLNWPDDSIQVVADPRQQAVVAVRLIGEMKTNPRAVALGSADTEVGDELARAFAREGWPAFHPAAATVTGGLARWFKIWSNWLADPTLATMADLLSLPETGVLVAGKCAQKAKRLAELRDRWMVKRTEDLQRRIEAETSNPSWNPESANEVLKAAETLEGWRASFLGENLGGPLTRMLGALARTGPAAGEAATLMLDWLADASHLMAQVKRGPGFWIELMLAEIPTPAPRPPAGRVLDVQGWLELFHEPGMHLVLCGMNEGKVPARSGGEPWLSEASRDQLGLIKDSDRAARDAFLYQSMLESRRTGGRVDVICGKSGAGGESLLPSRLLLAGTRKQLPSRVRTLFQEVKPPEAGMRWHADWQWTPRELAAPQRLNVTSLGDYLSCPFRYYLKHVVNMRKSEPDRAEWNARDFGTVAHEVLERWGRDSEARDLEKSEPIHAWLSNELDRVVNEWFGKKTPLAIRIQTEALRQRFLWLARVQATNRLDGWQVFDVERKVELAAGDAKIIAKIDRIDRHRDSGHLRVLDYKTGTVEGVEKAHRKKLTATSTLPQHIHMDCPAVYVGEDKGKSANFLWHNLQVPLYAAALIELGEPLATPCYFSLSSTEAQVEIHQWEGFEMADLEAAQLCAAWVAQQIAVRSFWPPAEKVSHDDYKVLAAGRVFGEVFTPSALQGEGQHQQGNGDDP
jgi:ATP-dependent helicase/nuclease subunit B